MASDKISVTKWWFQKYFLQFINVLLVIVTEEIKYLSLSHPPPAPLVISVILYLQEIVIVTMFKKQTP
jgi:hypothetical protein